MVVLDARAMSAAGALTLDLLTSSDWIIRRVETVRFLDASRLERRVSLDIDREQLRVICGRHGVTAGGSVLVPLAVLEKGLLLDLDVRGDDQNLLVVTSDRDSRAAADALVRTLDEAGVLIGGLSQAILHTILSAARSMPSPDDLNVLRGGGADLATVDAWKLVNDLSGNHESDTRRWRELLEENDAFWSLMRNFTASFMLMTELKLDDVPSMIKIRYVETQDPALMSLAERMGLAPYLTLVEAPGVTRATREHLRIESPPGIVLDEAFLWGFEDEQLAAGQRPQPSSDDRTYQKRVSLSRAAIYTSGLSDGSYAVALSMRANPSGFLRRAQFVLLLGLIMLASGSFAEWKFSTLTKIAESSADPTVALLLLVPTLLVAYVAREGDHQILSDLLRLPRLLVASTGLVTLMAATVLVAGVDDDPLFWLWVSASAWCALVLLWLRIVNYLSRKAITGVQRDQGLTVIEPLTKFTRP